MMIEEGKTKLILKNIKSVTVDDEYQAELILPINENREYRTEPEIRLRMEYE